MQKLILLLSVLFSISAFSQNSFVIKGELVDTDEDGKTFYLSEIDNQYKPVVLDSCVVKGKTFTLKGSGSDMPSIGIVASANKSVQAMVILEPGNISLTFIDKNSREPAKVTGTAKNDEFWTFISGQSGLSKQLSEMRDDAPVVEQTDLLDRLKKSTFDFAKNNSKNRIGEMMILDIVNLLPKAQITEIFSGMRTEFKHSEIGMKLNAYLLERSYDIGDSYADIKLMNPEGKEVSLSDYVGKQKLVLIDFWATWCGPCRKELPHLLSAYEKYKSKGLEIVGVSLDQDKDSWKNFIQAQKMTWPQISDLEGWQSKAAKLYGVKSIPLTLLIDQNGVIVAKNLRGEELSQKIEELLK